MFTSRRDRTTSRGARLAGALALAGVALAGCIGEPVTASGTGTVTMLEALRILKTVLPNPTRTILVGHWSGEEQGLNGSGAFTADHPQPINQGGQLVGQKLAGMHRRCNSTKSDNTPPVIRPAS